MSHDSKFAPEGLHHDHVQAAQSPPGHEHDDHWDGATYLARPGVRETAAINAENVRVALTAAGLDPATFSKLSVIEVGCGPGLVTEHLAKTYGSVHAIETSASQLRTFSHQPVATAPNVTWGLVSIRPGIDLNVKVFSPTRTDQHRKVAAPRDTFDVAVANLVVHHVDDLTRLFSGMLSVLKPGGIAVITEFTLAEDGTDVISDMRARAHGQQKKEVEKVRAMRGRS